MLLYFNECFTGAFFFFRKVGGIKNGDDSST